MNELEQHKPRTKKLKLKKKKKRKFYINKKINDLKNIIETTNVINNVREEQNKNNIKSKTLFLDINKNSKNKEQKSPKNINNFIDENSRNILERKNQGFANLEINNNKETIEKYTDKELNSMDYNNAKKFDKRNFVQYYFSLIMNQNLLIFTFFQFKDYNSQMIKIELYLFSFSINYIVNAMFYSDDTMNKIYVDEGKFDFIYQIPQMLYSAILSFIFEFILGNLGLYEDNILDVRKEKKVKRI